MKIRVRVHPGSRVSKVQMRGEELHVWVSAPPIDGRANDEVIEVLADRHHVSKSRVRLASGHTSRTKVFEVSN